MSRKSRTQSLDELAGRLDRTLVPVRPSARFVYNLGQELTTQTRQGVNSMRRFWRVLLLIGAATGAIVSVLSSLLPLLSLVSAIVVLVRSWPRLHVRSRAAQ